MKVRIVISLTLMGLLSVGVAAQDLADVEVLHALAGGRPGKEDAMNNDQLKHIASALNAIAFAEFAAFGYAGRATHRFGFRTALRFSGVIQIILLNMLIVNGKINSFKFCCAPADFIEEKPSFSAILGQKTCVSAQIHPLVRKHPLEALTSTASRGYCFN